MTAVSLATVHQKLRFPRGPGRIDVYASHYRVGGGSEARPLLLYIGGAVSRDEYIARMATEPVLLREQVEQALRDSPTPRLDVLLCPCPIDSRLPEEDEPAGHAFFEDHYTRELIPALGQPPAAVGLVGYSAGAASAVHLGVVLEEARAVATLGGSGVSKAARELQPLLSSRAKEGWTGLDVAIFRNAGDQVPDPSMVRGLLPRPLRAIAMPTGPGGHPFDHYAQNGLARGAFRFVLERLFA